MKRYENEFKEKALERMKAVGAKKTGEEMGISIQTLYKWRNSEKAQEKHAGQPSQPIGEEFLKSLRNDDSLERTIRELQAENAELRMQIARLCKAFVAIFTP